MSPALSSLYKDLSTYTIPSIQTKSVSILLLVSKLLVFELLGSNSHISVISLLPVEGRAFRSHFERYQIAKRMHAGRQAMAREIRNSHYVMEVAPAQIIHPEKPSNSPGLETIHEEAAEGFDEDS